ncbi:MAG: hypothetical protein ABI076_03755, partial [Acidobacteriaceae bacterium]
RAASDARMYTEQIAALRDALAALAPTTRAAAEAQRQLNQVIAQSQASSLKNNAKTATDIAKPYVDATNQINSAWLGMQNKLIFGTRNVGRAFANMGVQMLESVAGNFEKMLVKQLQYEVQSRIAHSVSNQLKVTSDAVAAGESSAITSANALKELFVHAKVDAAKAYGAYSGIPVIGPALGAGAAAATFAAIMAMGAFERGGIVPNTGIALVHGGEGVLPRNLTTMLTSVANSNSSMSSSSAVHSTANFNGITDRNFKDMARRHADTVADSVHRAVRNGRRF